MAEKKLENILRYVDDEVIEDIDRESRAGRPDIGADELTR